MSEENDIRLDIGKYEQDEVLTQSTMSESCLSSTGSKQLHLGESSTCYLFQESGVWTPNTVTSTKYTKYNFFFKAFALQFKRAGNVYFTVVTVLMFLGIYSSLFETAITPWGQTLMLLFIFGVNMLAEGVDDYKRYKSDMLVNNSVCFVLDTETGNFEETTWGKVHRGQVVRIQRNETVAADMLLLLTSHAHEDPCCYLETSSVDGETYLKKRYTKPAILQTVAPDLETYSCDEEVDFVPQDFLQAIGRDTVVLRYDLPDSSLSSFNGEIEFPGAKAVTFSAENTLLRGCKVRNVNWAIGVVLYTGHDTKILMADDPSTRKISIVDKVTNRIIITVLCLLGVLTLASIVAYLWIPWVLTQDLWYMKNTEDNIGRSFPTWLALLCQYIILYKNILPIVLYGILEGFTQLQSKYISWDKEMYCEVTNKTAKCNSSNLANEIGSIQWLFTDKTGTLTRNEMRLMGCSFGGRKFGICAAKDIPKLDQKVALGGVPNQAVAPFAFWDLLEFVHDPKTPKEEVTKATKLFKAAALCHSVLITNTVASRASFRNIDLASQLVDPTCKVRKSHQAASAVESPNQDTHTPSSPSIEYNSESPDEEALVIAAASLGFKFASTQGKSTVCIECAGFPQSPEAAPGPGETEDWQVLAVNSFSSARKRMSVVYRDPETSEIRLFCKGADNQMISAAKPGSDTELLSKQLDEFATEGFRTLVFGERVLEAEEFSVWNSQLEKAFKLPILERKIELDRLAQEIEVDLEILGVTAVEDRLQEGVPDTICKLRETGMNLWVITGDKLETAINVGYASKILEHQSTQLLTLSSKQLSNLDMTMNELNKMLQVFGISDVAECQKSPIVASREYALIVDGDILKQLLGGKLAEKTFLALAQHCGVLIACRTSPAQKADLVRLVQRGVSPSPITLAIGDGANDVPMIQAANVGVGISGKEGTHAATTADFSISQFRFLSRLLLVHGRQGYLRVSKAISIVFYANVMFVLSAFWFGFVSMFSGSTMFSDVQYTTFQYFIAVPVFLIGFFEFDITPETAMAHPESYRLGMENHLFRLPFVCLQMLRGVIHSALAFVLLTTGDTLSSMSALSGMYFMVLVSLLSLRFARTVSSYNIYLVLALVSNILIAILVVSLVDFKAGITPYLFTKNARTKWNFFAATCAVVVLTDQVIGMTGRVLLGRLGYIAPRYVVSTSTTEIPVVDTCNKN